MTTPVHVLSRSEAYRFFRVLGDETRLSIVQMLCLGDLRAGELGAALRLPSNALAYHLKHLQALRLLRDRRSGADARDVYYSLDLDRLQALYSAAGDVLHPGIAANHPGGQADWHATGPAPRPVRVLFLCTHNSARSQLAEGILRHMGGELVEAYSAGSEPTEVDPEALAALRELGIDPAPQRAKSLAVFVGQQFDYLITVCDRVRDACPVFPGDPDQIHWSFADPAVIEDPERRRAAFRQVACELQTRIRYLLLLPYPATGERLGRGNRRES
jgi:protein-tyrosine-phosphatase